MDDKELDQLLADGEAKEQERRDREAVRAYQLKRERRLEDAFHDLNVLPNTFHRETGEYPEYEDWPHCPAPPRNYWRWYAKRVINVADVIDVDGWKASLDQLEIVETNGRIALGLLYHAMNRNVDTLANKIEKAIMRVEDGPEAKAWLVVRIVRMLTNPPQENANVVDQPAGSSDVVSRENPSEATAAEKMSTEEVIERLLSRLDAGDTFPSRRKLAKEIDCTYYRIDMAFKTTPRLQDWEKTRYRKRPTQDLTDDAQAHHQKRRNHDDPQDIYAAKEAAENHLRSLIEKATEERRAKYLEMQSECNGDAILTLLRIEQNEDDENDRVWDRG